MRGFLLFLVIAACGTDAPTWSTKRTFAFGPFTVAPSEEITGRCVYIDLKNDQDIYINEVDLDTGPGFHHSNWYYFPKDRYAGMGSVFDCDETALPPTAGIFGGVLFAQSTQVQHEVQAFPAGHAIRIPAHSSLVANVHLFNTGDTTLALAPHIALVPIPESQVTTQLGAIGMENHALGLPANARSKFTLDCDFSTPPANATWPAMSFHVFHALAHYHKLGIGMTIEAVKPDNTAATIFDTTAMAGDSLAGSIDPPFDTTSYSRLRFSCEYDNTTAATVSWGNGTAEMCVFLAWTDSNLAGQPYNWGGGATFNEVPDPSTATIVGGEYQFTHACTVFAQPVN